MSRKSLERKRERLLDTLPPLDQVLRASLFERRVRCGKPSCHCAEGEGHVVWCAGASLDKGKTVQITLPQPLVPLTREWIRNYDRLWRYIEDVSAINRELLRQRWVEPGRPRRRRSD